MLRFAVLLSFLCLAAAAWGADSPDAQYLQGLRERQLFELAEFHCRERLRAAPPGGPASAELTLEMIRTLALHAANSPPEARDPLWVQARAAAGDFLRRSASAPRALLVRVQDALTLLAQGELARQEFEAGALAAGELEPARLALREATDLLTAIDKELALEVPLRRRTPPRPGELTAEELLGLSYDVQQQLARAQRNRALLAERGSDDRRALLLAAIETLRKPLLQLAEDEPQRPLLQLDLAQCQRLLGQFAEAGELASALDRDSLPPPIRIRARAEQLRIALARRDLAAARQAIERGPPLPGEISADWDLACFEAYLELARASTAAEATKDQSLAADQARLLDEKHGAYWGRRADQLLLAALPRGGGSAALLARQADGLYLQQKLDEALAAYDDAASAARTAGDLTGAFELAYKAALVEQQRGRHAAAANRLRLLSKGMASHAQAPAAHLLAAWHAGQATQADPQAAGSYIELLREHQTLWPSAETASQAGIWLGAFAEARGDWTTALSAYAGIPPNSPHSGAAIRGLASGWRKHLAQLAAEGQPTAESAAEAIRTLVRNPQSAPQRPWTDADRTAALAGAELIVRYAPAQAAEAEQMLRAALDAGKDAPAGWRTAAQAQLALALAAQAGREAQAAELLKQISTAAPEQLLAIAETLTQIAARAGPEGRSALSAAQLAAVKLLEPSKHLLTASELLALNLMEAQALAAAGQRESALAAFAQLAKGHPDSGAVQAAYGELLLDAPDRGQLERALSQWRLVAGKCPPRSPRWQQAKYSIALAQFKLGDRAAAAALLRYLLDTPPGLQGQWAGRCRELLRLCEASR